MLQSVPQMLRTFIIFNHQGPESAEHSPFPKSNGKRYKRLCFLFPKSLEHSLFAAIRVHSLHNTHYSQRQITGSTIVFAFGSRNPWNIRYVPLPRSPISRRFTTSSAKWPTVQEILLAGPEILRTFTIVNHQGPQSAKRSPFLASNCRQYTSFGCRIPKCLDPLTFSNTRVPNLQSIHQFQCQMADSTNDFAFRSWNPRTFNICKPSEPPTRLHANIQGFKPLLRHQGSKPRLGTCRSLRSLTEQR